MAIKNLPIGISDYYKEIKVEYKASLEESIKELESVTAEKNKVRDKIFEKAKNFKQLFGLNISDFEEYRVNKYVDGTLQNIVNKIYRNTISSELVKQLLILVTYVNLLKKEYDLHKTIPLYTKIANITYPEFKNVLKTYYYEVQRQMIVNGYGYKFQGDIGIVCINRCKNAARKHTLDTKATRANIKKLKEEGKEIYDEAKAKYYKEHNLKYEGVDPKIYTVNDYMYEFCLIHSRLPSSFDYKFQPYHYWADNIRHKTKEDFKAEANGNLSYICNLDINFTTKVTICNEMDETLYLNFIRNDNQTSVTTRKNHR